MLAAGLIRGNLQAHLPVARVAEQPPSSTPTSLLVRTTRSSPALDYRNLEMRKYDRQRWALSVLSILSPGGGIAAGCRTLAVEDSGARSAAIREQTSASPG